MTKHWLIAPLSLTLAACSITQDVAPVSVEPGPKKDVCVIDNPPVQQGFRAELLRQLKLHGYEPRLIAQDSPATACPLTVTYVAHWSWDLAIYLTEAEIHVFADGREVGHAVYDSRGGDANLGKYISAEAKVDELVGKLFPAS
jgi:hypothetical protein